MKAGQFDLFPSAWGLHKGHKTLTEAIEMARNAQPVVVTCGMPLQGNSSSTQPMAELRRSLSARWDKLISEKKLVVMGGVPEKEMQALRAGCRAYVIPAQYEGFGFPMVEAVYYHRPAIVSDIPAHREILKRYLNYRLATVFSADSSQALAAELGRSRPAPEPAPANWQKEIEAIWSWKNTTRSILSALGMDNISRQ